MVVAPTLLNPDQGGACVELTVALKDNSKESSKSMKGLKL